MSIHSSPAIRHSKVTYGRRHKDPDPDSLLADTSVISNSNSADEPPSSDGVDPTSFMGGLADDDITPTREADVWVGSDTVPETDEPKFAFEWRKQLAAMDDSDDEEGQQMVVTSASRLLEGTERLGSFEADERTSSSPQIVHLDPRTSPPSVDLLPRTMATKSFLKDLPAFPSSVYHLKPRGVLLSDEEGEPSSPQTPSHSLHHLVTPQKHTSPTPPTSEETAPRSSKTLATKIPPPHFDRVDSITDEERSEKRRETGSKFQKAKDKRVKPPTRKEREETEKTTARIKAAQQADIPRGQTKRLRLNELFAQVGRPQSTQPPPKDHVILPSDPIEQWSSSSPGHVAVQVPTMPVGDASRAPDKPERYLVPIALEDSDDDMPDVSDLIKQREEQDELRKRATRNVEHAAELKRRALVQQQHRADDASDDDDGIIISKDARAVTIEEDKLERRQQMLPSSISWRKRQLSSIRPPGSSSARTQKNRETSLLFEAAITPFGTPPNTARHREEHSKLKPAELNALLLKKSGRFAQEIMEEKERNWRKIGGRVLGREDDEQSFTASLVSMAQRGLQNNSEQDEGESWDDSDTEWKPEVNQIVGEREDVTMSPVAGESSQDDEDRLASDADENDKESEIIIYRRRRPHANRDVTVIVDSDDEGHCPRSSEEENVEGETDKENNAALMFDQGEDKENTVIHPSSSLLHPPSTGPTLSQLSCVLADAVQPESEDREAFRDIPKEDDPFLATAVCMPAPSGLSLGFAVHSPSGHSEDPLFVDSAPILHAGLSQLFGSGTAEPGHSSKALRSFSQFVTPAKEARGLGGFQRDNDGLALTFNASLQPALEVTDSVRKKADSIFEKEQELLIVEDETFAGVGPQMFVNENGFLTQTRPSNLDVSRLLSSTQSTRIGRSPSIRDSAQSRGSGSRRPLGDIDLDELRGDSQSLWSEARPGGGRLKRRRMSLDGGYRSSVSPSPSPLKHKPVEKNAYQIMREAQMKKPKKMKLNRSDFVDGQAEESDEDDHFGFGAQPKKKDEEDEEQDNEEELETLNKEMVDDTTMDESTLNEEMVLEKHREQVEEDDAVAHKVAQDAISGKLRARQGLHGIGFEDEDDSDEDEDNTARRQKMMKQKRKLGGYDSLHMLSKDDRSAAFLRTYDAGLEDDDLDFKYLNEDIVGQDDVPRSEKVAESDEEHGEVSVTTLLTEMREVSRGQAILDISKSTDTSWLEEGDDMTVEEALQVQEISKTRAPRANPVSATDWDFEAGQLRLGDTLSRQGDGHTRGGGLGRSVGVSAVTGHTRTKQGGGSIIGQWRPGGSKGVQQIAKPMTRAPSRLSAVSSRRAHFAG